MRADYWFPSHRPASREVKELLGAILVVDPAKRLTIAQIQQHPWCAHLCFLTPAKASRWSTQPKRLTIAQIQQLPWCVIPGPHFAPAKPL